MILQLGLASYEQFLLILSREGNVFTPVCHSVHRGCIPACIGADTLSGQTPPWSDTPLGRHHPPQTATPADGTHPTVMHTCFTNSFSANAWICLNFTAECSIGQIAQFITQNIFHKNLVIIHRYCRQYKS